VRARMPLRVLEVAFLGVRLQLSIASLATSTLSTLSSSYTLAEVAAKLALTLVAVTATEVALLGYNRGRYPLIVLALPLLTLVYYYSVAIPGAVLADLILLPVLSLALGLCLAPSSYLPKGPLLPLLSLFSAYYAITPTKVLGLGFDPAYRVLWHVVLSLALMAIGFAGSRALRRYSEHALSYLSYLRIPLSCPETLKALLFRKSASAIKVAKRLTSIPKPAESLVSVRSLTRELTSVSEFTERLTSAPAELMYVALAKIVSFVAELEKTLAESVRRASLAVVAVEDYMERSLTYSLLLIGFLSTVALITYAIITALR